MRRRSVGRSVAWIVLGLLVSSPVLAQDENTTDPAETPSDSPIGEPAPTQVPDEAPEVDVSSDEDVLEVEPENQYQISLRSWIIGTPAFILDGFFSAHTNHWSDGQSNFAFGGEFALRRPGSYDIVVGLDWANIRTPDGYWLEDGDPVRDADWTENTLSLLALDVAIHWLTDLNPQGSWQLYYGLGIGVALRLGAFTKWNIQPGCLQGQQDSEDPGILEECFDADGEPFFDETTEEEENIPPAIPALSLTFGSRWIISDQFAISLEMGFKSIYLYSGLEFGYIF